MEIHFNKKLQNSMDNINTRFLGKNKQLKFGKCKFFKSYFVQKSVKTREFNEKSIRWIKCDFVED